MADALDEALGRMDPISLEDMDASASLRRRVDTKYVVSREALVDVVARAADAYRVLQIDGRRTFAYESVYFDTRPTRAASPSTSTMSVRASSRARACIARRARASSRSRSRTAPTPCASANARTSGPITDA
jgi:hypothetical protein